MDQEDLIKGIEDACEELGPEIGDPLLRGAQNIFASGSLDDGTLIEEATSRIYPKYEGETLKKGERFFESFIDRILETGIVERKGWDIRASFERVMKRYNL